MIQPVVIGSTYDWFLNAARLNTEASPSVYGPWDITGATVTISFVNPTGTKYQYSATLLAGTGTARYINTTSLFNVTGTWTVSWKVSLSGTVLESQPIPFTVASSNAAA